MGIIKKYNSTITFLYLIEYKAVVKMIIPIMRIGKYAN